MMIGERLLNLRKEKHLSQEEVAEKLKVTRQTISKWETDVSTPDFDKIAPLCELYGITADELLTGNISDKEERKTDAIVPENRKKKATGISLGILFYFIAVIWIMVTIPVFNMDPILSSGIFLAFCGIGTYIIVYTNMVYGEKKKEKEESKEPKLYKQIKTIIDMITLLIYLYISFVTFAWHITWILWVVAALLEEIIKLFFMLGGKNNAK